MGQRNEAGRRVVARLGRHEILLAEIVVTASLLAVYAALGWLAWWTDWGQGHPWMSVVAVTVPWLLGYAIRVRLELVPPLDPPLSAWKRPRTAWRQWWAGPTAGPAEDGRQGRPQDGPGAGGAGAF